MQQRLAAQPGQQFRRIRRIQNVIDGVVVATLGKTFGDSEQVQVMVAQHGDRAVTQRFDEAQRGQRLGTAIDQIADEPETIAAAIEPDSDQQALEFIETTLHVTDGVSRHLTHCPCHHGHCQHRPIMPPTRPAPRANPVVTRRPTHPANDAGD